MAGLLRGLGCEDGRCARCWSTNNYDSIVKLSVKDRHDPKVSYESTDWQHFSTPDHVLHSAKHGSSLDGGITDYCLDRCSSTEAQCYRETGERMCADDTAAGQVVLPEFRHAP